MNIKRKYFYSIICVFLATLMIVLSMSLPVGALSLSAANSQDKIDATLKEKIATASPDEKIPVYIWYTDIDHKEIEKQVKQSTNLTDENLAVDMEMPSVSLINRYQNKDPLAIKEASEYLDSTKAFRRIERARTNEYINAKREFSREKYIEKSHELIKDFQFNNILFKSQYAPMIMAELSESEIECLVKDNRVENVSLFNDKKQQSFEVQISKEALNQVEVADLLGLSGEGVDVGIIEAYGHPNVNDPELANVNIEKLGSDSDGQDHATNVANIIAGSSSGFAPDSDLVSVYISANEFPDNRYYYREVYMQIEQMIFRGVKIINCSTGASRDSRTIGLYNDKEKWFDHIVSYHNITFVVAAGNDGAGFQMLGDTSMGYNSITVGAYDDQRTVSFADDKMADYSSYKNSYNEPDEFGLEKPDVVMPGNLFYTSEDDRIDGTSYATPMITGALAQMFELKPSLAAFPQAVKAIVLASCHRKVLPTAPDSEATETMEQGITERQGAGVPDVWTMACIISQGTYGVGIMSASDAVENIHIVVPYYGAENMNVSLTWLREVVRTNEGSISINTSTVGEYINLDLAVYKNDTANAIGMSAKTLSSTEMTYVGLDSAIKDYEIKITKPESTGDVRYGFAYSTDNTYATPVSNDGIYRIKNLETDTYMTLDPATNEIKLQEYTDSTAQQWVLKSYSAYQISSAYNNLSGIINRGNILDATSNKAILGNSAMNFTMFNWENNTTDGNKGAVMLYTYIGGTQLIIDHNEDEVTLTSQPQTIDGKYWVLEKINYRRGDCNMDGILNINDSTRISKYLGGEVNLSNIELFLADADYDGQITESDRVRIQRIIAGLSIY